MKNIMNIILLFPILIYVFLLLFNSKLLTQTNSVNIFWITNIELPFLFLSIIFFIVYIFLIYFSSKFSAFFTNSKINSLEKEKLKLKEKIADLIPEIEKNIDIKYSKILEEFKEVSNKNLELHKNQTKQVLENLEFEIKTLKDKLTK